MKKKFNSIGDNEDKSKALYLIEHMRALNKMQGHSIQ